MFYVNDTSYKPGGGDHVKNKASIFEQPWSIHSKIL